MNYFVNGRYLKRSRLRSKGGNVLGFDSLNLEGIPYWKHMGIEMREMTPGHVKLAMKAEHQLTQMAGVLHGGAIASLMDSAMGAAVWSLNRPRARGVTAEMNINYISPVLPGEEVEAEARVINNGNTLSVCTVEVRNLKGRLVSFGTATFMLIKIAEG